MFAFGFQQSKGTMLVNAANVVHISLPLVKNLRRMAEKIEEKGSEQQRAPLLHLNLKNVYLLPGAKKKVKRHDGKHDHSAAKKERKKEAGRSQIASP